MQDPGRPGKGRRRSEVRKVQARLSSERRHSGDAAGRGDCRTVAAVSTKLEERSRADSGLRILLVRLRLIGDVVFTTPAIRALRRHYPDAHITYLVEPSAAEVLRNNPHLNDVILAPRRRGAKRLLDDLSLARRLRRERFDLVIGLHGGPRAAWLTLASGAPMRIGYEMPWRSRIYTHRVQRSPDLFPRHSVLNQWDLLAPLGIGECTPEHDPVEMSEDATAARRVRKRLDDAGIHDA